MVLNAMNLSIPLSTHVEKEQLPIYASPYMPTMNAITSISACSLCSHAILITELWQTSTWYHKEVNNFRIIYSKCKILCEKNLWIWLDLIVNISRTFYLCFKNRPFHAFTAVAAIILNFIFFESVKSSYITNQILTVVRKFMKTEKTKLFSPLSVFRIYTDM